MKRYDTEASLETARLEIAVSRNPMIAALWADGQRIAEMILDVQEVPVEALTHWVDAALTVQAAIYNYYENLDRLQSSDHSRVTAMIFANMAASVADRLAREIDR